MDTKKARVIAYYLPQFHSIPENDEWWGQGFTEWSNVKKAKSLYKGHIQPKFPGELGYYDLNNSQIIKKQEELAIYAGIEAFCYWHYWFGNGKQLLEKPFKNILNSKETNLNFCLGWANESWKAKVWSNPSGSKDKILIEQTYPGDEDIKQHFFHLISAFKDDRYVKIDGKPLFVIYKPIQLPEAQKFINIWTNLAKENGLNGIFFVGHTTYSSEVKNILKLHFDAVNVVRLGDCRRSTKLTLLNIKNVILYSLNKKPLVYNYKDAISLLIGKENERLEVFPSIVSNWDNTPRSGIHGFVLNDSTPDKFQEHVHQVIFSVSKKPPEKQIIFIKSWNEWGEGNYIEPDKNNGRDYLKILRVLLTK